MMWNVIIKTPANFKNSKQHLLFSTRYDRYEFRKVQVLFLLIRKAERGDYF